MIICNRCGKCCHFLDELGNKRKCKHLVILSNGKTLCRIYSKRLNQLLYKTEDLEIRCNNREDVQVNYKDCPFNKEGQEELW